MRRHDCYAATRLVKKHTNEMEEIGKAIDAAIDEDTTAGQQPATPEAVENDKLLEKGRSGYLEPHCSFFRLVRSVQHGQLTLYYCCGTRRRGRTNHRTTMQTSGRDSTRLA